MQYTHLICIYFCSQIILDFKNMYGMDLPEGFSQDDLFALLAGQGHSGSSNDHAFNGSFAPQDTQQGSSCYGFDLSNTALFSGGGNADGSDNRYPSNANAAFWN